MEKEVEKVITMTECEFQKAITGKGVEFKFLKLDGKINSIRHMGIKVTAHKRVRDDSYKRQATAAEHKVGPPVGMKLILITESGYYRDHKKIYYGFETGIASMKKGRGKKKITLSAKTRNTLNKLKMGSDMHSENIGKWKRKMVAIDFGDYSVGTGW